MRLILGCALLATMGGLACQPGSLAGKKDVVITFLPDPLLCAASGWNVVHPFGSLDASMAGLRVHDGTAYLAVDSMGIFTVPVGGGDPVLLPGDFGHKLWIEGETIYFAQDDRLMQMPLAGGEPALVADGLTSGGADQKIVAEVELDAAHFYWRLSPTIGDGDDGLWWMPRAGGAAEQLLDLPSSVGTYNARSLATTDDGVIMALTDVAYLVSSAGEMRTLSRPPAPPADAATILLGAGGSTVLWASEGAATPPLFATTVLSLGRPGDGDATPASPFWPDKPAGLVPSPLGSFPDGNGGWIVTGTEMFSDESVHVSVWSVDAAGSGARIGCSYALPSSDEDGFVETAAVTADAVYVLAGAPAPPPGPLANGYTLVRLDRPVAVAPVAP